MSEQPVQISTRRVRRSNTAKDTNGNMNAPENPSVAFTASYLAFTDDRAHNTVKFTESSDSNALAIPVLGGTLYLTKAIVATRAGFMPAAVNVTVEFVR
jgi:hypothetical protein